MQDWRASQTELLTRLLQQHLLTQQLQIRVEGARAEEGQEVSRDSTQGSASPEPAETVGVVLGARGLQLEVTILQKRFAHPTAAPDVAAAPYTCRETRVGECRAGA